MSASGFLKQSTTDTVKVGPFLDATDGVTEETAITPVVEVSKDNGAFAARNSATAITHDAEGYYDVELDSTDTNTVGRLVVKAHDSATHLPVWHEFWVLEESIFDALFAASAAAFDANQRVDVGSWLGSAVNALVSGRVDSSVGAMASAVLTATAIASNAITSAKIATDAIGSAQFAQAAADKVWSSTTRTLTAFSTALALSVWDVLESAIVTANSIGLKVKNNLDAAITSRATQADILSDATPFAGGSITEARLAELDAANVPSDIDTLLTRIPDTLSLANVQSEVESALEDAGQVLVITTIATLTSQTVFTLTDGSSDDNAYDNCVIIIEDSATATQKAVGYLFNYVGSTKEVTLGADPAVFTMAAGDKVSILAPASVGAWRAETINRAVGGRVPSDVQMISGDVPAADNLEADYDGTGYNKSNSAIGTAEDIGPTGLGNINTEVDNALDTAVPTSPTADSINERVKAIDELTESGGSGDLATLLSRIPDILSLANINAEVDTGFTTQIADSVPADGVLPTREQALYMVAQMLMEFAISGTTLTVKKVDGTTTLMTFTLDDDTNPTSLTRAT